MTAHAAMTASEPMEQYLPMISLSTSKINNGRDDEKPVHKVIFNYDFEIGTVNKKEKEGSKILRAG